MDYLSPFLDSMSQGLQVVQHLRAAAAQKEQLDKQNQLKQQRLSLSEKLGNAQISHNEASQKLQRDQFERTGKQQNFQDSLSMLQNTDPVGPTSPPPDIREQMAAQPYPGASGKVLTDAPIPGRDPSRIITSPSGEKGYVPTREENSTRSLEEGIAKQNAGRYQFKVPDTLAEALGVPTGSSITLQHPPTVNELSSVAKNTKEAADKPVKAPASHWTSDDKGTSSAFTQNDDGTWKAAGTFKGTAPTRPHPAAGGEAGGLTPNARAVAARFDARTTQKDIDTKDKAALSEQAQHRLKSEYGSVLRIPNGEMFQEPGKAQKKVEMTQQLREGYEAKFKEAEAKAADFQRVQSNIVEKHGFQGAKGAEGEAQGTQGAAQPRVVTLDRVREYAKKRNISEADAIKEFTNYKWQVK